jgi:hypothetical protein
LPLEKMQQGKKYYTNILLKNIVHNLKTTPRCPKFYSLFFVRDSYIESLFLLAIIMQLIMLFVDYITFSTLTLNPVITFVEEAMNLLLSVSF